MSETATAPDIEFIGQHLADYADESALQLALAKARPESHDKKSFDKLAGSYLKQFKELKRTQKANERKQLMMSYGQICEVDYPWPGGAPFVCIGFKVQDDGIFTMTEKLEEIQVVNDPVLPIMRTQDSIDQEWYTKYAIRTQHGWRYKTIPQKCVTTKRGVMDSLSGCISGLTDATADYFVQYLNDITVQNSDSIPSMKGTDHLGWQPDGGFMPFTDNYLYTGQMTPQEVESYGLCGSEKTQVDYLRKIWDSSGKEVKIMLATSLASADNTRMLSFWVHIFGFTGTGKSALLTLCASLWGNPAGTIRTFNSTNVAQENMASMLCDIPLFLDEAQTSGKFDDIGKTIYKNTEGRGKSRGQKTGGNRATGSWRSLILSTGEAPLLDTDGAAGGGAFNRLINLDIQGRALFRDYTELFDTCSANYGHMGKLFTERLKRVKAAKPLAYKEIVDNFAKQVIQASNHTVSGKQANNAARILAAATTFVALIGAEQQLTMEEIVSVLTTNSELDVNARCYRRVQTMFIENRAHFEGTEERNEAVNKPAYWGKLRQDERGDVLMFFVNGEFVRQLSREDFNIVQFAKAGAARGIVLTDPSGKTSRNTKMGGSMNRAYHVRLNCDWESGLSEDMEEENDKPF